MGDKPAIFCWAGGDLATNYGYTDVNYGYTDVINRCYHRSSFIASPWYQNNKKLLGNALKAQADRGSSHVMIAVAIGNFIR